MAEFDNVFAEAQKQVAAINAVLAAHPNILREVQKEHSTQPDPKVVEEKAQDYARANALKRLLEQSPIGKDAPGKPAPDAAPGA